MEKQDVFLAPDGKLYVDYEIEMDNLTGRLRAILIGSDITRYSQLETIDLDYYCEDNCLNNVEKNTLRSILTKFEKSPSLSLEDLKQEQYSGSLNYICIEIIQSIIALKDFNVQRLYKAINPVCINYYENNDNPSVEAIMRNSEFISALYNVKLVKIFLKDYIINKIKEHNIGIRKSNLFNSLPFFLRSQECFDKFIDLLIRKKYIFIDDYNYCRLLLLTFTAYLQTLTNSDARRILELRLQGLTVNETAKALKLKSEAVRDTGWNYINKAPLLKEDKYKAVFLKYDFTEEDFLLGFQENKNTYRYLCLRYLKGKCLPADLALDKEFSDDFRRAGERIKYKNYIFWEQDKYLKTDMHDMVMYTVNLLDNKIYGFDEFILFYQDTMKSLGIDSDEMLNLSHARIRKWFKDSCEVLLLEGHIYKYKFNSYDFSELLDTVCLEGYDGLEISPNKFMGEYESLMARYDIPDSTVLLAILKRLCSDNDNIEFFKSTIHIGNVNIENQVKQFLVSFAPISVSDFCDFYEVEYGIPSRIVKSKYIKYIENYRHDNMFSLEEDKPLRTEIIDCMQQILTEDLYLNSDIEKIYRNAFPNDAELNNCSLKKIGFTQYSGYVLRSTYDNALSYFTSALLKERTLNLDNYPASIKGITGFRNALYQHERNWNLIEFAEGKYVSINALEEAGFTKDILRDFCSKVRDYAMDVDYFTYFYLVKKCNFTSALDAAGFDEKFYSSILKNIQMEGLYGFEYGHNWIFTRYAKGDFKDFILSLINANSTDYPGMDIYGLKDMLFNDYRIFLSVYQIRQFVKDTSLYYDDISERVYSSYDDYINSIW